MTARKRHSGVPVRRQRVSDGGTDWGEIILGAAAGVGGYYLLESFGILGGGSGTKNVGTQILPDNPAAYVGAGIGASILSLFIYGLFFVP